ncbi:restriction endonuclease [Hyphomicrobium sp. LHD-15]|uniref:restriction endonuclease n=1 Tax=Hyphomicrobium sp. LHD-15 TaxID=3072142 RepID=UPI00281081CC|nr:restriction endonuclease [Hyphomicrobium sp. LHD-15]MDQ8699271.1 restriction endonuclease [Hyphomicrobium sp. LHD-15]
MTKRALWYDCGFSDPITRREAEPTDAVSTVFWFEGPMHRILNGDDYDGLYDEFHAHLEELGYWFENVDGTSIHLYPNDTAHAEALKTYLHWKWVCSLINEDTGDVYEELYQEFSKNPLRLEQLSWREFETLLYRVFQNQGFEALIGPGRNDGGIDLRLIQRAPLGDILTIVQAKRYASHRKIGQTDVAALYGVGKVENADRTLFVTSSSYAPVSKRWAARTGGYVELAEAADVVNWCSRAAHGIIADKSSLVSLGSVEKIVREVSTRLDYRLVHASGGWNITDNWFALVLKETKHAALLMKVPKEVLSHDGYGQRGTHVPKLDGSTLALFGADNVWRAKRSEENGRVTYWDGERLYSAWNGEPCHFDYCD